MTQIWILLSLFVGTLLISGTSGSNQTVEVTKETLKARLAEISLKKENMIKNLTAHGLDYFAYWLNHDLVMAELYGNLSNFQPVHAQRWTHELDSISDLIDHPFHWQDKTGGQNDYSKSNALYLNAIIAVTTKNDSRDQTLLNDVAEIITLEKKYEKITTCEKSYSEVAIAALDVLVHKLAMLGRKCNYLECLRMTDFFVLEDQAVETIRQLKSTGNVDVANLRQQLLDRFLAINIRLGQTYPLDSHVRMNQYFNIAQEHYRQYVALKDVVDSDRKRQF